LNECLHFNTWIELTAIGWISLSTVDDNCRVRPLPHGKPQLCSIEIKYLRAQELQLFSMGKKNIQDKICEIGL
jgi:hypothetical protein